MLAEAIPNRKNLDWFYYFIIIETPNKRNYCDKIRANEEERDQPAAFGNFRSGKEGIKNCSNLDVIDEINDGEESNKPDEDNNLFVS